MMPSAGLECNCIDGRLFLIYILGHYSSELGHRQATPCACDPERQPEGYVALARSLRLMSLVVTRANRHDVAPLAPVLDAITVDRPSAPIRRHNPVQADAGYTGAPALNVKRISQYFGTLANPEKQLFLFRR